MRFLKRVDVLIFGGIASYEQIKLCLLKPAVIILFIAIFERLESHGELPKRYSTMNEIGAFGFEPPTFRLTAERANRLRHRDRYKDEFKFYVKNVVLMMRESKKKQ